MPLNGSFPVKFLTASTTAGIRVDPPTRKIDLSATPMTTISLPFIAADANGPRHLETELSRQEEAHP